MQNNELCYTFDCKNKIISTIKLQPDHMNGGFFPKPPAASYIDPSNIELKPNETLRLINEDKESEKWQIISFFVGKKLYNKVSKSEMTITEIGKSPEDYPDYTDTLPNDAPSHYYDFSELEKKWIFDLEKYASDALNIVTSMCIEENYRMLPQHKRDNIYAGSPASDGYPSYLQGAAGKQTIAQLNAIFQGISESAKSNIQAAISKEQVDSIIAEIKFPSEAEILSKI